MLIVPSLVKGGVIGGKLINLETPTGSFLRKIKNTFYRVVKLKRLIRKISPDFIVSFMGNLQPILTFEPVIVSIRNNPDFFSLYRKFLLKTVYKLPNVKKIITCSLEIEKKLNNNFNLKNAGTIYNPLNLDCIAKELLAYLLQNRLNLIIF
jgi:hypothetical protein